MDTETRKRLSREQSRRIAADPDLRRKLARADWGRALLWEVRWDGEAVADLIEPRKEAENWVSYKIAPREPVTDHPAPLESAAFWLNRRATFVNRSLNLVATEAFPAGEGPKNGRIRVRGLRFELELSTLEELQLWWQRITGRERA